MIKIQYHYGDLFKTSNKLIAHGCNAQRVMGSGVAKIVRDQYPEAYSVYKHSEMLLGSINYAESKDKIIINAITQKYYGRDKKRYVSYDAVAKALSTIEKTFGNTYDSISLPQIGAGYGGGSWKVIEAIIEDSFKKMTPHVYIL